MRPRFFWLLVTSALVGATGSCLSPVEAVGGTSGGGSVADAGDGGIDGTDGGTGKVKCRESCPVHSSCDPATTVDGACICERGYDALCRGTCTNLSWDPDNCGFCGHTCACSLDFGCEHCFESSCM